MKSASPFAHSMTSHRTSSATGCTTHPQRWPRVPCSRHPSYVPPSSTIASARSKHAPLIAAGRGGGVGWSEVRVRAWCAVRGASCCIPSIEAEECGEVEGDEGEEGIRRRTDCRFTRTLLAEFLMHRECGHTGRKTW